MLVQYQVRVVEYLLSPVEGNLQVWTSRFFGLNLSWVPLIIQTADYHLSYHLRLFKIIIWVGCRWLSRLLIIRPQVSCSMGRIWRWLRMSFLRWEFLLHNTDSLKAGEVCATGSQVFTLYHLTSPHSQIPKWHSNKDPLKLETIDWSV